jgi:hypothetical protein
LDALACYRLTRLIVADGLTAPLRDRVVQIGRPMLTEYITCPWCVSPPIAGMVVLAQSLVGGVWIYLAAVLAFSAVAGLLSEAI